MDDFTLWGKRVWVAGHRGMVGSAVVRRLAGEGCVVLTCDRSRVDLCNQGAVAAWVTAAKPDAIIVAAAKVGGIMANSQYPAEFIYDNVTIAFNIIHSAWLSGVEKLLYLGSSCIYPRLAPQPIRESALLTGPLEPTNQWYAVAKIAGIMLCQAYRQQYGCNFISAMPTNLYGPGDNFDLQSSHVLPALLAKFHHAVADALPAVEIWGTGTALREFLHVDDLADALVFLIKHYSDDSHINVGYGEDISIRDLASLIAGIVGFDGAQVFDTTKPDGTPRKLIDSSAIRAMGWAPKIDLRDGLRQTYDWYVKHLAATQDRVRSVVHS